VRVRDLLASWLPLLLMALLALGSWWLVKNVPPPLTPKATSSTRTEPDYTMSGFTMQRFEANGRLKLRIAGAQMRHFPDTDRIEVEQLQMEAFAPDGRITRAVAQRGVSNGDGSEIQLFGQARVTHQDPKAPLVELSSEFLHLYTTGERLHTHLPAQLTRGRAVLRAVGLSYDHGSGLLALGGPARMVLPPGSLSGKDAP
jgi:lipopolysaccharide export system protein LptC